MFLSRRMDKGWVQEGALASGRVGGRSVDMDGMCVFLWLFFVCVSVYGICGVLGVIACGNLFLVKRRIFAKEGWHYDTWHVMSEDFM